MGSATNTFPFCCQVSKLAYLLEHFLESAQHWTYKQLAWIPPLHYFLYQKPVSKCILSSPKAVLISKQKGETPKKWQALRMRLWIEFNARNNQMSIEVADCPGTSHVIFFSSSVTIRTCACVHMCLCTNMHVHRHPIPSHLMSCHCIVVFIPFKFSCTVDHHLLQHRQKEAQTQRERHFIQID